jgi:hypothetical protein
MIEFLFSRASLSVVAIALMAVAVGAFSNLNNDLVEREDLDQASLLADVLFQLESSNHPIVLLVDASDFISNPSITLILRNGSIWIDDTGHQHTIDCPSNLVLIEEGRVVEKVIVGQTDRLRISTIFDGNLLDVQVEKVDATILTPSMNLLHSSTVL